jgi:hypothetical protein
MKPPNTQTYPTLRHIQVTLLTNLSLSHAAQVVVVKLQKYHDIILSSAKQQRLFLSQELFKPVCSFKSGSSTTFFYFTWMICLTWKVTTLHHCFCRLKWVDKLHCAGRRDGHLREPKRAEWRATNLFFECPKSRTTTRCSLKVLLVIGDAEDILGSDISLGRQVAKVSLTTPRRGEWKDLQEGSWVTVRAVLTHQLVCKRWRGRQKHPRAGVLGQCAALAQLNLSAHSASASPIPLPQSSNSIRAVGKWRLRHSRFLFRD